jgi:hypothetical protein
MGKGMSPVPKKSEKVVSTVKQNEEVNETESSDYNIILKFNSKAELFDIEYPQNLSLAVVNNHVVVAVLFLAQQLVANQK